MHESLRALTWGFFLSIGFLSGCYVSAMAGRAVLWLWGLL